MPQPIEITCGDGFKIAATLYQPEQPKAAIMIGPATGIKKEFYNSFATHLQENGFGVIAYDNRGIGESIAEGNLNAGNASLITWGRMDQAAVLQRLTDEFPGINYHLIGHSAGGQLVGLMPNAQKLTSIFNFACSSGSLRNMSGFFWWQAHFFMNFYIPVSNLIFGHTKSQWVGMGEPLPKNVAQHWRKWCNGTGYVEVEFGKGIKDHLYYDLKQPSMWMLAEDDTIANLANVKDMARVYKNSETQFKTLNPKDYGFKDIGHMKFFSSRRSELWQIALDWLEQHN